MAVEWIALARKRYACLLNRVQEDAVATRCPQVPAFYQMLDIVHHSCLKVPTVLYTVHCDVTHADFCRVKTTTISGQLVKDVLVPRGVPFNARHHVPEPPHCIADDMNLYTRREFEDYYGRKASDLWIRAPPCYDHVLNVITANGELVNLWDNETSIRTLFQREGV